MTQSPLPYDSLSISDKPTVVDLLIPYSFYKNLFEPYELEAITKKFGNTADLYATCTLIANNLDLSTDLAASKIPVRLLLRTDDIFGKEGRGTLEEAILNGLTTENYTFYHKTKDDKGGTKIVTATITNVRKTK